jgi:hypothetical protein
VARCPAHVTLRAARGLPSLREARAFAGVRAALAAASGPAFRVLHWSVQSDHLHLVVEADAPRALRHCLLYVLQNWRKHVPGARGLDPRSSAAWFHGWRTPVRPPAGRAPVAEAQTWLARVGWLRWGRLGVDEAPRGART